MTHEFLTITSPVIRDDDFRIGMTCACRDSDFIPKVADAGKVIEDNGQRLQIMHNGIKVIAGGYGSDMMIRIIGQLRGHHEPQEEAVFHEILKHLPPKATMIELGGFWSYYSLWFLQGFAGERQSVVVEPDTENLRVGRLNAQLNDGAIEFINAAVGAEPLHHRKFACENGARVTIPQVTVPGVMERCNIQTLDILHCDIQGFETEVLLSCRSLLAEGRIRFCVISTHAAAISGDPLTHQRCLKFMQDAGGRILAEHDVHESFSGDGLIVAYFGRELLDWTPLNLSRNRYSTSLFRNPLFDLAEAGRSRRSPKVRQSAPFKGIVGKLIERLRLS